MPLDADGRKGRNNELNKARKKETKILRFSWMGLWHPMVTLVAPVTYVVEFVIHLNDACMPVWMRRGKEKQYGDDDGE